MKKGDLMEIYEDPLTQRKYEGDAFLQMKTSEDENTETWKVQFTDGEITFRKIKKDQKPIGEG